LRQRQRTATRPDPQNLIAMSNRSDKGLHAVTSQCYAPSCPTRTVARMYGSGNPVGGEAGHFRLPFAVSVEGAPVRETAGSSRRWSRDQLVHEREA
jgi:hypothetical protein